METGEELFFVASRRRHTRLGRDWSSDVCSSDLDQLKVEIEAIDLQKKQADFRVIKTKPSEGKKKNTSRSRKPRRGQKPDHSPKRRDTQKQPKAKRRQK